MIFRFTTVFSFSAMAKNSQGGFSIVELLVVLVILSAAIWVFSPSLTAMTGTNSTEQRTSMQETKRNRVLMTLVAEPYAADETKDTQVTNILLAPDGSVYGFAYE